MADAASGGAGPAREAWGGAGAASRAMVAAAGRAVESERKRERVSKSERIGFARGSNRAIMRGTPCPGWAFSPF
jgi:hypothetical protein